MIYVLCPEKIKTGGTELLHQLVFQLNNSFKNEKAIIAYIGNSKDPEPLAFDKYIEGKWININEINENEKDIFIFPETELNEFDRFRKGKKYIWWLSVDNYILSGNYTKLSDLKMIYKNRDIYRTIGGLIKGSICSKKNIIKRADLNLYQSFYAKNYLDTIGVPNNRKKYLSDYINDYYIKQSVVALSHSKKNVVLYNPKKGYKFTKKIINL